MAENFTIDFSGFDRLMREKVIKGGLAAAREGMGLAGQAFMNDAIMEIPATPLGSTATGSVHPGRLRGSASMFVNGMLNKVAPDVGGGPTPAVSLGEKGAAGAITATVAFNTPYAAYQHEGVHKDGSGRIKRWTTPGTNIKFLESKRLRNSQQYFAVAAARIKQVLEGKS